MDVSDKGHGTKICRFALLLKFLGYQKKVLFLTKYSYNRNVS